LWLKYTNIKAYLKLARLYNLSDLSSIENYMTQHMRTVCFSFFRVPFIICDYAVPNGKVTDQMRIEKNTEENHCDQRYKRVCLDEHRTAYYNTSQAKRRPHIYLHRTTYRYRLNLGVCYMISITCFIINNSLVPHTKCRS